MRTTLTVLTCVLAASAARAADKPDGAPKGQAKPPPPAFAQLLKGSPEDFIKRFDRNKDGVLSKNELPPRFGPLFDRADTNGDGKLDQAEVAEMLTRLRRRLGIEPPAKAAALAGADTAEADRIVERMLRQMDTDKDGKISRQEAKNNLSQNFDRIDTNKDGFLDREELRRAAVRIVTMRKGNGPAAGKAAPAQPAGPDFDALDSNADGRLTRAELRGTPFAQAFDQIDTNKDGKIDRKEFAAYLRKQAEPKGAAGK
jgi:Ca2+-binding EF-hand superfamily protein